MKNDRIFESVLREEAFPHWDDELDDEVWLEDDDLDEDGNIRPEVRAQWAKDDLRESISDDISGIPGVGDLRQALECVKRAQTQAAGTPPMKKIMAIRAAIEDLLMDTY
jgi:hypothetical protein